MWNQYTMELWGGARVTVKVMMDDHDYDVAYILTFEYRGSEHTLQFKSLNQAKKFAEDNVKLFQDMAKRLDKADKNNQTELEKALKSWG